MFLCHAAFRNSVVRFGVRTLKERPVTTLLEVRQELVGSDKENLSGTGRAWCIVWHAVKIVGVVFLQLLAPDGGMLDGERMEEAAASIAVVTHKWPVSGGWGTAASLTAGCKCLCAAPPAVLDPYDGMMIIWRMCVVFHLALYMCDHSFSPVWPLPETLLETLVSGRWSSSCRGGGIFSTSVTLPIRKAPHCISVLFG